MLCYQGKDAMFGTLIFLLAYFAFTAFMAPLSTPYRPAELEVHAVVGRVGRYRSFLFCNGN